MPDATTMILSDGHAMPRLGLGVWQTAQDDTALVVRTAVATGYRHIDTAMIYHNEAGVGAGIASCGLARDALFVTTKLWNDSHGRDAAFAAFDASLHRLGLEYVDLYLIHWPVPAQDLYVESWRALIELQRQGRVRSIGVSNFTAAHLRRIIGETGVVPAANQVELHPRFQQVGLRTVHAELGIATICWSPLGQGGDVLQDPTLMGIAAKHGRTVAQVVLRWQVQSDLLTIPKSSNPKRLAENIDVFGFVLDEDDLRRIGMLDVGGRMGPDPDRF